MKRQRSHAGIVFIIIGILFCLGAAALLIYNTMDSDRAGRASEEILAQFMDEMQHATDPSGDGSDPGGRYHKLAEPLEPGAAIPEMATIMIDGYECIGMIAIPSLNNLELPVMKDWDYNRLRVSPCLYTGSYYTNNLVICGHNYTRHFGRLLDDLKMGADVYFVTAGGEKIHFIAVNKQIVEPTDIDAMIENSSTEDSDNEWDLTLFTCTYGGQTRCAVRCVKTTGENKNEKTNISS